MHPREKKKKIFGEVDGFTAKHSLCCHFLTGHSRWNVFRSRLELFYASICLTVWQKGRKKWKVIVRIFYPGGPVRFFLFFFFSMSPFVVHMLTLSGALQQSLHGSVTIKKLLGFLELLGKIWTAIYEVSVFVLIQRQLFWQEKKENEILRNPISSKSPKHSDQNTQAAITHSWPDRASFLTWTWCDSGFAYTRVNICLSILKRTPLPIKPVLQS